MTLISENPPNTQTHLTLSPSIHDNLIATGLCDMPALIFDLQLDQTVSK